ncbi:HNH endonuclease signature motif containing protein [Marmoricola sp. URHB0036]|uniref:HNH endonuclease signature motif containing protein n=1 Tax=Marmoricola sp. URHB0036 TaxID=1298863 RepID=UPI00041C9163|nr:HNH endonuclease signature motif containing protein [Marmoricola sp. URHB0036]
MDTTTLTATEVIDGVRAAQRKEHEGAVEQLQFAVRWALIHPCRDEYPAGWEDDHGIFATTPTAPLAGAGAPLVDEFAPASFAAALGISLEAAKQRIADALELVYRLPRLWELVEAGVVPVWRARLISRETHDLSPEAVAFADRLISATPSKIGLVDAARLVQEARLYFDPDRAVADEEEELARRGVWIRHRGNPATTDVVMTLDTPDALLFDQTVGRIAGELRSLGDSDQLDVRRARAVGILADPQYALDLMSGREGAAPGPGSVLGAVNLFVHLDPDQPGAVSIEKLGAATDQLLTDWLRGHAAAGGKVIVRPVLDLSSTQAVDQHDPPSAMRELCTLRDAYCVFPGCLRDSRSCDLDHITAYTPIADGGPPGQTSPLNFAPLCRTHHRMKTFTAWDYKRRDDGTYIWTSPTGHQYEVPPNSRRPPRRA